MQNRFGNLATFVAIVQEASFTGGAKRAGVSKATASKQVAALEDRLGVRLLERTTRQLRLTEQGARLFERARAILDELEEAEAEIGSLRDRPVGRLRISAPVSLGVRALGRPLGAFMAAYPELDVTTTLNDRMVDLVDEGFDLALRIGRLADSSMIARRLAAVPIVTAAAPAYLDAHGAPETPAELSAHACLAYAYLEDGVAWRFEGGAKRRIRPRLTANNGDVLADAAVAGLGIVQMPRFILEARLAEGALKPILEAHAPPPNGLYVVYPAGRALPAKTRAFIDFMSKAFDGALG